MKPLDLYEVWFLTGSQELYGEATLRQVAEDAEQIAQTMIGYRRVGFHTFLVELPAPYDAETMETLIKVVKPMVEASSASTTRSALSATRRSASSP